MLLEPITQKKGTDLVKEAILNYIQANKLQPGARLSPDRELALMLNCSRPVVREALKGLEAVGVIEMKVGKGIFVSEFTLSNLLEKYHPVLSNKIKDLQCLKEARLAIEIGIIGLVVERATREDIDGLRTIIEEMERVGADDKFEKINELDIRFHQTLAMIARSPLLTEFDSLLRKFFTLSHEEIARMCPDDQATRQKMIDSTHLEHRSLVGAIEGRDKDLARKLMEEHLLLPNEQENPSHN